jgi:hypothetical protein
MKVTLQAQSLWDVMETRHGEFADDHSAMEAILCAVPLEMIPTLPIKKTVKEA